MNHSGVTNNERIIIYIVVLLPLKVFSDEPSRSVTMMVDYLLLVSLQHRLISARSRPLCEGTIQPSSPGSHLVATYQRVGELK